MAYNLGILNLFCRMWCACMCGMVLHLSYHFTTWKMYLFLSISLCNFIFLWFHSAWSTGFWEHCNVWNKHFLVLGDFSCSILLCNLGAVSCLTELNLYLIYTFSSLHEWIYLILDDFFQYWYLTLLIQLLYQYSNTSCVEWPHRGSHADIFESLFHSTCWLIPTLVLLFVTYICISLKGSC